MDEECSGEEVIHMVKKKHHISTGAIIFCILFSLIIISAVIAFFWRMRYGKKSNSTIRYSYIRGDSKGISVWADESKDVRIEILNKFILTNVRLYFNSFFTGE